MPRLLRHRLAPMTTPAEPPVDPALVDELARLMADDVGWGYPSCEIVEADGSVTRYPSGVEMLTPTVVHVLEHLVQRGWRRPPVNVVNVETSPAPMPADPRWWR